MQLEMTPSDCWIVKYTLLGKSVTKKFLSIEAADTHMYRLISYAYKYVYDMALEQVSDGKLTSHRTSRVNRRWDVMRKSFMEELDMACQDTISYSNVKVVPKVGDRDETSYSHCRNLTKATTD